jgi:hypothetical protein
LGVLSWAGPCSEKYIHLENQGKSIKNFEKKEIKKV